jgi:hypothetical protein
VQREQVLMAQRAQLAQPVLMAQQVLRVQLEQLVSQVLLVYSAVK